MPADRLPTLMIPHGGGPCFFMDDPAGTWTKMGAFLRGLSQSVGRPPKAALVISAHWESDRPAVLSAPVHHLFFDYYNFPPETYRLQYPAPGSADVAARTRALISAAGIEVAEEAERGLDHGVFIPFMLIYPQADVPIVQLSLKAGLDAATHEVLGRAIAPLRDEGVLIVGTGMTYHNLRDLGSPRAAEASGAFDAWLGEAVALSDPDERAARLAQWAEAPGGRQSHPREEHLLPLMVASGAAGTDAGRRTYAERLGGVATLSAFQFG
jgi:aromatic ring-opening dioxygenase catalytic subunit (LigB family)